METSIFIATPNFFMSINEHHFLKRKHRLNGRNTHIILARQPVGKVVIFVHGFGGGPNGTWNDFHTELVKDDTFKGVDFIFYNYDSLWTQATYSAVELSNFVTELTNDANYFFKSLEDGKERVGRRNADFTYHKIVFAAHSLGAVITRRALLNANSLGSKWIEISSMVLFAPAHMGTRVLGPIQSLFFPLPLGVLVAIARFRIATLDDVDLTSPHCSLHKLTEDTRTLQSNGGDFTIAKTVLWAQKDTIVNNQTFLKDPDGKPIRNHNHKSVCKPDQKYRAPIDQIKLNLS